MNHQYFWIPIYSHLLLHVINFLALRTFVSTTFHLFGLYISIQQFSHVNITCKSDSFPWNTHTQIHKVVKCIAFMIACFTYYRAAQLAFKKIGNYRIITEPEGLVPYFTLFIHRLFVAINFLVLRLLAYPI